MPRLREMRANDFADVHVCCVSRDRDVRQKQTPRDGCACFSSQTRCAPRYDFRKRFREQRFYGGVS